MEKNVSSRFNNFQNLSEFDWNDSRTRISLPIRLFIRRTIHQRSHAFSRTSGRLPGIFFLPRPGVCGNFYINILRGKKVKNSREIKLNLQIFVFVELKIYTCFNWFFFKLIIITEGEFALLRREKWAELVGATGSCRSHCYIKTRLLFIIEHSLNTCADTLVAITKGQRETGVHLFLHNRERSSVHSTSLPVYE